MDNILIKITDHLKEITFCEGIIYAGSRQTGDFTKTSDYDFTVLIEQGEFYYKIYQFEDIWIDICCATEQIINDHDLVSDRVSNAELSILAKGKILFDKHGSLEQIHKKAQEIWTKGPQKATKEDIQEASHLCTTFLHKLNKPSSSKAYACHSEILSKLNTLFFKLNRIWMPKPFEVEGEIQATDPDFLKLYLEANSSLDQDKIEKLSQLIAYFMQKNNLENSFEYYCAKDW